jgi:2-(1,2-epoxy-1,2-dihydrophenyl)acetyl-CoA isomerase
LTELIVDRNEGVTTLTFNRPESLNSLDNPLKVALRDALAEIAGDRSCRAVVLTGAGRAFCVGQDLKEHVATLEQSSVSDHSGSARLAPSSDPEQSPLSTVVRHYNPIAQRLADLPKPVVAAVRGAAAGAGASLAFLADFRVGGPGTSFLLAFSRVGLAADTGASWSLPRLVGYAKAVELMMLAQPVDAAESLRLGLLTKLVDNDEDVLPTAQELAARLAAGPTVAYAAIKRELSVGTAGTLSDALAAEAQAQSTCGTTADHRNATLAFVRKEKAVFEGR